MQREKLWKQRFDELHRFQTVYGHCLVPERYHEDVTLGTWVAHQRRTYKDFLAGETTGLTLDKIRSLHGIGFCWTERDFRWYGMLERLKGYVEERRLEQQQQLEQLEDTLYRPEWFTISYDDQTNRDLRLWVAVQRKEYSSFQSNLFLQTTQTNNNNNLINHKRITNDRQRTKIKRYSAMTQRRINVLEAINFPWKSSRSHKKDDEGPTVDDWSQLFVKMREKGIDSKTKAKTHWFEGESLIRNEEEDGLPSKKNRLYTEEELLDLWNSGDDDDED